MTIHHPTLLSIILDVSLAHGLLYESDAVLRVLLFVALSPASTGGMPPVCHPTHSAFFLELRTRWLDNGFPDQTFCRIVVEVLLAVRSPEAWGCKAVHKLAKKICGSDFLSFMELVSSCTSVVLRLGDSNRSNVETTMSKQQDNTCVVTRLRRRIHQWLDFACDHCTTTNSEESSAGSDAVYGCLELSLSCLQHDICSADNAHIHADLQATIVCLATLWLTSSFVLNSQRDWMVNRLGDITPRSSTYVTLVTKTFAKWTLDLGQRKIRSIAMMLRLQNLLRLETSLWACVLRHIEHPTSEHLLGSSSEIEKIREYRDRLIDLVDDAEDRCFGVDASSRHTPRGHAKVDDLGSAAGHLNCEWHWEAIVRCWVRKDNSHPSTKKRKIDDTKVSGARLDPVHNKDMPLPLQPSSSNFTSLLANAFLRRTVLRDVREKKTQAGHHTLSPPPDLIQAHRNEHEGINLPSDDLLDLFICESSMDW
jgi:hypothetical protein